MLAMIAIPAAITLRSVQQPAPLMPVNQNSTPHGYTFSLLLFIIPSAVIGGWFLPSEGLHIPQRAFYWTLGILVPLGFVLDFVFAQWFFCYPNRGATLGIDAPALGRPVPVEEYVFYLTGFLTVLLLYIWLGEFWLAAYNVIDYPSEAKKLRRMLQFHPTSLILAAVLIGAAWFYKKHLALPDDRADFPGYFTFLVAGGFLPAVSFFPVARRFINWRALSLTLFFMLLVSLLWEATLAVPYLILHASALTQLGVVRRLTGDFPGAVHDLQEALGTFRDAASRLGLAEALTRFGVVRRLTGDHPGAARDLREGAGHLPSDRQPGHRSHRSERVRDAEQDPR